MDQDPKHIVALASQRLKLLGEGIFEGLIQVGHLDSMGLPMYRVVCKERYNEWGKGITPEQSQASAIMERVERVSSIPKYRNMPKLISSVFSDLKNDALPRSQFGTQNIHHLLYGPKGIDSLLMNWAECNSLVSGKKILVPAQLAYFRYPLSFNDSLCTTGLASGTTLAQASIQALCEVLERHNYHIFYFNRPKIRRIDLTSARNPSLKWLLDSLWKKGFTIHAHEFCNGWKIPSVFTFLFHPKERVIFPSNLKCGTALDPEIALIRALTEQAQTRAVYLYKSSYHISEKGLLGWNSHKNKENLDMHSWLSSENDAIPLSDLTLPSFPNQDEALTFAVNDFSNKGYDVLRYDLTHEKLQLPVVRMIVPGTQPNFLVRGLHQSDRYSCVTEHLSIHAEHQDRLNHQEIKGQKLVESVFP